MKYMNMLLALWLVIAMIAVPATFADDTNNLRSDSASVSEVADHLSAFEQQAADVSRSADDLWALTQNHRPSRQSHAYRLNNLRDEVNAMGRMLAELEQMMPQASEAQQMAIERARPHLVALANETAEAIKLARAGSENLRQPQYKETVTRVCRQADILYQTVETIVDYHNADDRLDKLEASHSGLES